MGKWLTATTGVTPWRRTIWMWRRRLSAPATTSSGFSALSASGLGRPGTMWCAPVCAFMARTVVTTTTASGRSARKCGT